MNEGFAETYGLAPSVQTWPFDVSGSPSYLVEVGLSQRFEVTAGVYRVIELLRQKPRSVDEIVAELQAGGSTKVSTEKISWLVRSVLLPRRIAEVQGSETAPPEALEYRPAKKRSSFLWLQIPLLSPEALSPLTRALSVFFNPWIAVPLLGAAIAAYIFFYAGVLPGFPWALADLSLGQGLLLLLALNVTAMFHEVGHASACRYFGSSHGKIGWGIYLFMLVLYTDVSPVWRLTRWQRAVVDAGGMYFEAIATLVFLSLYGITGHPLFVYAFVFVNLSMANSLNPILRQDGYWLLSDLSGQTNLRQANLEVIRYAAERATGRKSAWRPELFSKPKWLQATIVVYTAVSVVFSITLVAWLVRHLAADVIPMSWHLLSQIRILLDSGKSSVWEILSLAGTLGLQVLFVLLVGVAAWSLASSLIRPLFQRAAGEAQGAGMRAEWKDPS